VNLISGQNIRIMKITDIKIINNTAIAAFNACTTTRLLLLSMHALQHGPIDKINEL